jgi:hypothetical protein
VGRTASCARCFSSSLTVSHILRSFFASNRFSSLQSFLPVHGAGSGLVASVALGASLQPHNDT